MLYFQVKAMIYDFVYLLFFLYPARLNIVLKKYIITTSCCDFLNEKKTEYNSFCANVLFSYLTAVVSHSFKVRGYT